MATDSFQRRNWHAQDIHDAHALAVGRIVIAWTEFQETLAELFAHLFGKDQWGGALARWQVLTNDSAQRDMLRAAALQRLGSGAPACEAILWIFEEANKLSRKRNFGVHTPLMVYTDVEGTTSILPNVIFGNIRAGSDQVQRKDLVELFGTYEAQIRKMTTFVIGVSFHVSDPKNFPLPEKPQFETPEDQPRKVDPKSRKAEQKSHKLRAHLPRGLADRAPPEIAATRRMMETIRQVYELYGFEPVETPAIEYTDVLGKFLPDQDRPNKGVFSFRDDDEQWLSLRYDLTAPLARYVAGNFDHLPKPYRSYRAGYVYRNEKPGPGRFRQFMQFDADTVGSASMAADAEICMMAADTMEELGVPRGSYVVKVNNRKVLDGVLEAIGLGGEENAQRRLTVLRAIDKYDRLGDGAVQELLGPGRRDESGDFAEGAGLSSDQIGSIMYMFAPPPMMDLLSLSEWEKEDSLLQRPGFDVDMYAKPITNRGTIIAARNRYPGNSTYQQGLDELQQIAELTHDATYGSRRILIDPSVVRGLEYYTGPVYEVELTFPTAGDDGKPVRFGSVGGGGRYDGLVARFRGEPVPATGFSIGVSRLLAALTHLGKVETRPEPGPVIVTVFDKGRIADYQRMASTLRQAGIRAELYLGAGKFGPQMKYADRRRSPCVVIQGSDEKAKGEVQIKDLIVGAELAGLSKERDEYLQKQAEAQFAVPEADLVAKVREVLARHGVKWG